MELLLNILKVIWYIPRNILIGFIWVYQKILSPDHSFWGKAIHINGYCKYYPTCSQYMKKALHKYGVFKGLFKGLHRIARCNPWSEGGVDKP